MFTAETAERLYKMADEGTVVHRDKLVSRSIALVSLAMFVFFGKRFAHGEAFQLAAEQYNTQPERVLPSTDGLHLFIYPLTRGGGVRLSEAGDPPVNMTRMVCDAR